KGGIAYRLETDAGYRIPRRMQIELSQSVQRWTDASGEELSSERLRTLFEREYLRHEAGPTVVGDRSLAASGEGGAQRLEVELQWEGVRHALTGVGPGPLDAFVAALSQLVGQPLRIGDYQEHVLGERGSATA